MDSLEKLHFANFCQLKVTFFGRTTDFLFQGKSIIVDFKKEGVLKNHPIQTEDRWWAGMGAISVPKGT